MSLKIRCDGESEKFCKIFWELNKAQRRVEMAKRTLPAKTPTSAGAWAMHCTCTAPMGESQRGNRAHSIAVVHFLDRSDFCTHAEPKKTSLPLFPSVKIVFTHDLLPKIQDMLVFYSTKALFRSKNFAKFFRFSVTSNL